MQIKDYKNIFFHGYIGIFILLLSASMFFDIYIKNYNDAIIEMITLFLVIGIYFSWKRSRHKYIFAMLLAWISALFGYTIVVTYDFTLDTQFYLIFVPFAFYYLLNNRLLLINLLIYIVMTLALMFWGYLHSHNRLFFDDFISLSVWISLFIFVLAIGLFNYLSLAYSFKYLEDSNTQKEILLQEVHHRVKNNLNMMSSMMALQETDNDPKLKAFVNDYRNSINAIALIHELLYGAKNYASIHFKTYVQQLADYLIQSCANPKAQISIEGQDATFSLKQMTNLGLILQELISNSLKYANAGETKIQITLQEENKNTMLLGYRDNGSCIKHKNTHTFGIELVRMKVKELQGELEIKKQTKEPSVSHEANTHNSPEPYYLFLYSIRFPHEA